ncbi:hypothetical protein H8B02_17435 [Bradyrhizobium sp. Pear77]|uniref:hypothetical protein n=1 Tax=Bradyrhizobium altum TaxID=1571202 RepID=UPI001E5650FB|nr:hypothetical protein [Bradyrhizobium altum]MCC8955162.1 hypothetical protein [Bradyrhizobium altum]
MTPDERVGAAAIERTMAVFEQMKDLDHCDQVQARKAVTDHFGQIAAGELDEKRSVVSGLTHLKTIERNVGLTR